MSLPEFGFELNRRLIANCGVEALAIVVLIDKSDDIVPGFFYTSIVLSVDFFDFERLHEAFGFKFGDTLLFSQLLEEYEIGK